jgi:curved DNA-binding protein
MNDYYKILGIDRASTQDQIKQAYRRLASKFHPDHGGNTDAFQKIQTAYSILSDPEKKDLYDNPIHFNGFFDHKTSPFDIFRGNFSQKTASKINLWLDISDILNPTKKIITVTTESGTMHNIQIDIPKGVEEGSIVRYNQLGINQENLIVVFRIKPDPNWFKSGLDLITNCSVSIWTLIAGGNYEITDPSGTKFSITVPPYTKPQSMMRIRGRGFPDRNNHRGDLLIKIQAEIPSTVSPELFELIKKESLLLKY